MRGRARLPAPHPHLTPRPQLVHTRLAPLTARAAPPTPGLRFVECTACWTAGPCTFAIFPAPDRCPRPSLAALPRQHRATDTPASSKVKAPLLARRASSLDPMLLDPAYPHVCVVCAPCILLRPSVEKIASLKLVSHAMHHSVRPRVQAWHAGRLRRQCSTATVTTWHSCLSQRAINAWHGRARPAVHRRTRTKSCGRQCFPGSRPGP